MFKKKIPPILAVLLGLSIGACAKTNYVETELKTPVIRAAKFDQFEQNPKLFDSYSVNQEEDVVCFNGTAAAKEETTSMFDKTVVRRLGDLKNYSTNIKCYFSEKDMTFYSEYSLVDKRGNILTETKEFYDAFVTEDGMLDTYFGEGKERVKLSECRKDRRIREIVLREKGIEPEREYLQDEPNFSEVDNCGLFSFIVTIIVIVIIIVAETAEQIKSEDNFKYNKQLESNNNGVEKGNMITNQEEIYEQGYKAGNYRYGFASFSKTGCAIASVYNLLIKKNKKENLSTTVHNFEKWCIEVSVGFGHLGSNPYDLYRYFKKHNIGYNKYTGYNSFKSTLNSKSTAKAIVALWNKPFPIGMHVFYLEKMSNGEIRTYNDSYISGHETSECYRPYPNLTALENQYSVFEVGYIIK